MHYTEITRDQMTEFLKTFGFLEVLGSTSTREYVFDYTIVNGSIADHIVVRVFSSIHKDTAISRVKGADAIRVCAVNLTKQVGWIRTTKVLRVAGWKDNLYRAIFNTREQALSRYNRSSSALRAA
jgi:hypothetical protein